MPDPTSGIAPVAPPRKVLNIGCGPRDITRLHEHFPPSAWQEIRLDADPAVKPDFLVRLPDMGVVGDSYADALWTSHLLEHLPAHDVMPTLREFLRVLRPGGVVILKVPDLQAVAGVIADDRGEEPLYTSGMGPVSALDIVYGFGPSLAAGHSFMAHRTGFTATMLKRCLEEAGFVGVSVYRQPYFELCAVAFHGGAASYPSVGQAAL